MTLPQRPSPHGKPVSLFVTCLVDMLFPETGLSVVKVLEHLGLTVEFPLAQTCCGQPAYNAGYRPSLGPDRHPSALAARGPPD